MTLERKTLTGTLSFQEESFPLEFHVWSGEDCRLSIDIHSLDAQAVVRLQAFIGDPGSRAKSLVLEGADDEGTTFFSDTVEVHGARMGRQGNTIKVEARRAEVTVDHAEVVTAPVARLWLRGFKSFHPTVADVALGQVTVRGKQKPSTEDEASGNVTLQAPPATEPNGWMVQADRFLTFMHLGLAFAHGGRLQTPRMDLVVGNLWTSTYYSGRGFKRSLAPIHYLNQEPFVQAIAKRFDDPEPFPDKLWTAVGWLHSGISIAEASFLMSMTALETIVEQVIPKKLTAVMPKADYGVVRSKLVEALAECHLEQAQADILKKRLEGLNSRSLSHKVQALRDHYGFSEDTFSPEAIVDLIGARNSIVHTGESSSAHDLWPKEVLVRELIALIVFREIGYDGPYESYVNG